MVSDVCFKQSFVLVIPVFLPLQTAPAPWRRAAAAAVTFLTSCRDGWEAGALKKASTTSSVDQGARFAVSAETFRI